MTPCNSSGKSHFKDQKKSLLQVNSTPALVARSSSITHDCPGFGSGVAEIVGVGLGVGVGIGVGVGLGVGIGVGDVVGAATVF